MKTGLGLIRKAPLRVGALLMFFMVLIGCSGKLNLGMEGTYVDAGKTEFSVANDTLLVEHSRNEVYFIHRRTGFQLLDDSGKAGDWQYEKEEWIAVYDPKSGVMQEKRRGKVITFAEDGKSMMVGKRIYTRIN